MSGRGGVSDGSWWAPGCCANNGAQRSRERRVMESGFEADPEKSFMRHLYFFMWLRLPRSDRAGGRRWPRPLSLRRMARLRPERSFISSSVGLQHKLCNDTVFIRCRALFLEHGYLALVAGGAAAGAAGGADYG